jgi:hypothetical protein
MGKTATVPARDAHGQSNVWRDELGRTAGTVYFDSLGHRRVVTPPEFYDNDDNLVATGDEAVRAFSAMVDEHQAKRGAALRRMPAKVRRDYATYLRTGRLPEARARAPREARNDRPRGSRRSSSRRSSERSGDSGSEGGEPEPSPAGRRECECCGLPLTGKRPQARYLNDAHRKRAQRQRDRLEPDRVAERRLVLLTEAKAPPPVRCKCDPKGHLVDGVICVPCGRARGNGGVAWLAGDIPSRQLSVHQPSRAREWRTRPNRSESARLRSTRRDYIDQSIIKAVAA